MVTPRFAPDVGGVERHVAEVSARLAARGCAVTVLCTDRMGDRAAEEDVGGVRVKRVRAWPRGRDYYLAPGLWREIARHRCDVVHVQSYHTAVAPLAMARAVSLGIPFVLTFHGGGHSSALRHRLRVVQRRALRPLLRRAARLIAVARFEIEHYGSELHLPREAFELIPNGVHTLPAPRPTSEPIVASIGRLEPYKGHGRVLDAFPYVLETRPEARLWLVGQGPDESRLRRRASDLGLGDRVEFLHVAADDSAGMASLLSRVRLVVSLSDFETHPLAVLEALAAGRNALVADIAGLHELVEDGLARGIAIGSQPTEVASAILDELGDRDQAPPISLPTWDDCVSRLLDVYREALCGS